MKTRSPRIIVRNLIQQYQKLQQEAFEISFRNQDLAEAKYREANQLLQLIGKPTYSLTPSTPAA